MGYYSKKKDSRVKNGTYAVHLLRQIQESDNLLVRDHTDTIENVIDIILEMI